MIFPVLPLMVKFLVAEAVFPEYLPVNQAVERRVGLFRVDIHVVP